MKRLKRRTDAMLELHERQAAATREAIDALRKLQQELRLVAARQASFERRREQLALAFIKCATSVGGSDPALEVSRGG